LINIRRYIYNCVKKNKATTKAGRNKSSIQDKKLVFALDHLFLRDIRQLLALLLYLLLQCLQLIVLPLNPLVHGLFYLFLAKRIVRPTVMMQRVTGAAPDTCYHRWYCTLRTRKTALTFLNLENLKTTKTTLFFCLNAALTSRSRSSSFLIPLKDSFRHSISSSLFLAYKCSSSNCSDFFSSRNSACLSLAKSIS
jgi:hypothetical protein